MRKLKLLLSGLLLLFSVYVYADLCIINNPQELYQLQSITEIAEDKGGDVTSVNIGNYVSTLDFQPYKGHSLELKTNQKYWGRFQIKNDLLLSTDYVEWILEFSGSWTDLDVFIEQQDGTFEQLKSGVFVSNREKKFVPELEGNFVKIVLAGQQTRRVFFHGEGKRGNAPPSFIAKLSHSDAYFLGLKSRRSGQALYIGFIVMMLLYNLIFYFINRDRSYLYYSIYLSTLVVYTSFVTGDLADWIEPTLLPNHPQFLYFGKIAIYIGLIAYFAFLRRFLDLKTLLPKWDKFLIIFSIIGIPWIIVDVFLMFKTNFSYIIGDSLTLVYIGLFILINIVFAYRLYQTKDKKGYFIVAGIAALCLGFLLTAFEWMQTVGFSAIYSIIGSIVEVVLFSLGLAYRQWEGQKAKQKAYFELEKSNFEKKQEQAESLRLKQLDELKTDFYTAIAHEFRTPLTVIMGMNENISNNEKEKQLIRRNSENLLQLINQMLDLSKLESGDLTLNKINADIVAYMRYLTESFYSLATDRGVRLTFYSEAKSVRMDYDEVKIQHIIYNLLSNAIKFTNEGGKVILHLKRVGNQLVLKVQDTGNGIAPKDLPHLFDRFYQGENSRKNSQVGTGIGLTLTRQLVELMQGEIKVESQEGEGTDFVICLPIENKATTKKEAVTVIKRNNALLEEEKTTETVETDGKKKDTLPTLLIIEDNADVVTYIRTILQKKYKIHTAKNGQLGIEKAIELVPDIIISDVMMPIKNGYEVCETLKKDERTSHVPIILLTAKATPVDKLEGLTYGADAFLTKPFPKDELLVRLEQLIIIRQKLQQRYNSEENKTITVVNSHTEMETNFLQKLQNIVEENLHNNQFGVPELEKSAGMSKMQVYRKLKALMDKTPSAFIRSVRLQKGKELLQNSDLNISEIAYEIGFSDPNYFSRTFQKEYGTSPKDFRN